MIKKYINIVSVAGIVSLLWVSKVFAQGTNNTPATGGGGITNPLKGADTLPELLVLLIEKFVLPIGGIIVTFMIIYTGFKFVIAQGDPGEITKAKQSLLNTIIGAAIILGALSISLIIKSVVGEISGAIKQ